MTMGSPCVLVGNLATEHVDYDSQVAGDKIPRCDYLELARRIGATLPLHKLAGASAYQPFRKIERRLSLDISLALQVVRQAREHSVIVSMSETVGIPVAAALKLSGARTPHVVVGHRLAGGVQQRAWRRTSLQHSFAAVVTFSRPLRDYAASPEGMGVAASHFVFDKVDQRFFRPLSLPEEDYVLAVGQEQRDYGTLLRAVTGTPMRLVIVASSPWASVAVSPEETQGVTVLRNLSYTQLRELYARARLVAVPVHPVDYAAGVNGLLEGMAMGKAVVCTASPGLDGYVEHGVTGLLVPPSNPAALREALAALWSDPRRRATLGHNARAAVEKSMNLDRYINNLAGIIAASARQGSFELQRDVGA